jgi:hypothetical protein
MVDGRRHDDEDDEDEEVWVNGRVGEAVCGAVTASGSICKLLCAYGMASTERWFLELMLGSERLFSLGRKEMRLGKRKSWQMGTLLMTSFE